MKKCVYCKAEISSDSVIDLCAECGRKAFGEKMLKVIIENMENAREKGDLYQGIIGNFNEEKEDTDSIRTL